MKKLQLFALLFLGLSIASCSSDDDNTTNDDIGNEDDNPIEVVPNHFTHGETEVDLVDGMVEYYGDWVGNGGQNFDINLASSELSGPENDYMPVDDVFSAIYFEVFTDNSTDIAVGTYEFAETGAAGTYASAFVLLDIDMNNPNEDNVKQITSGTLNVIQNGDNYEFEFSGLTAEGTEINMYYDGALHQVDFPATGRMANGKLPAKRFSSIINK